MTRGDIQETGICGLGGVATIPARFRRSCVVRIRSVWLTKFVGWLAAVAMRALFRTVRIESHPEAPGIDCAHPTDEWHLYALWHDAILIPIAMKARTPGDHVAALVSRHQDGSYLTEFMRHVGIRSVRGSTNHGGDQALRELMRRTADCHVFITPDGPRGPRRELKDGIVFLASRTGRSIIPVASAGSRVWNFRGSWTDLTLPKPFSRAVYVLGPPIFVPRDISRDELQRYRSRVQSEMDRLQEKADSLIRGEPCSSSQRRAA